VTREATEKKESEKKKEGNSQNFCPRLKKGGWKATDLQSNTAKEVQRDIVKKQNSHHTTPEKKRSEKTVHVQEWQQDGSREGRSCQSNSS